MQEVHMWRSIYIIYVITCTTQLLGVVQISLKDEYVTNTPNISVGKLVDCQNTLEVCKKIKNLNLYIPLKRTNKIQVYKNTIRQKIDTKLPNSNIRFTNKEYINVVLNTDKMSVNMFTHDLHKFIESGLEKNTKYKLKNIALLNDVMVWRQPYLFRFEYDSTLKNDMSRSRQLIKLHYSLKANPRLHTGTSQLYITIEFLEQVLVADRSLYRGDQVGSGDVVLDWKPKKKYTVYIKNFDELKGLELRIPLAKGVPLQKNYLRDHYVVKRGELRWLEFKQGNMVVMKRVKVLKNAKQGDIVSVMTRNSRKRLRASILDNNKLKFLDAL